MSIIHVQDAALGSAGSAQTQQSGAFGSQPTVGNYIVAWSWGWINTHTTGTPAFTDTGGNTYTVPANAFQTINNDLFCIVGYTKVITAGASFKITSTVPGAWGTGSVMVCAAEFSGIPATSPQDGTAAGTTGTSVTIAPGSMNIASGSLVVGVSTDDNSTYGGSTPTGFTRVAFQNNGSSFQAGEAFYAINPSSPTNPNRTITSAKWASSQFALLASSSGAKLLPLSGIIKCRPDRQIWEHI